MMKRAVLVLVVALSTSACAAMSKGGARGPVIQRTSDDSAQKAEPQTESSLDARSDLGQR
jgi:hypothetical protein